MSTELRAELAAIRAAMEREDRINACQHAEDDGRCLLCEADAEYMVPPCWVRDSAAVAGTIAVLKSGGIVSVLLPLALVAAVGASGCATWQQTTKTSLDAASAAAETAHVAVRTHFDAKCEAIARDCAKAKLPACPSLVTCQEERHKPIVALSGIQAACLVGYSAIVIADKGTALQKAAEVARLVGDLLAALKLVGVKL